MSALRQKPVRLSYLEIRTIVRALRDAAKGDTWGVSSQQVRELADLIANADGVRVTPGSYEAL